MTNIIQFPQPIPVTNGNYPQFKFAVFGDNLSTVTTANYLTSASIQAGIPLSNADVIMALYSFNTQTVTGTFGIFTVSISASNGQITLTEWANPGDAVLPTTANYIAHFTNTTGTISSAAGNVIQPGNISAGLAAGGTAGTLASFPATGSKGSLILAGVANTGNTNTTISNDAMGQASVINIPDPANAIGQFVVGATATPFVSGNFPQNSGTAGLMVDSGIPVSTLATTSSAVLLTPAADQSITIHNLAVAQGNLTAGSSGHAGTVTSFPGTAANGSLILAAVNAGGAFNMTLSNGTLGQSSVITVPDPAAATANFVVAPAALVSGNLNKASGTAGLVIDSGITATSVSSAITQLGQLFQVNVTFNTASMVTAYDTPLTIVANPSASQVILLLQASVYTASTGHTPYATGTAPIIQYSTGGTNGQHGAGTIATAAGLVAGDITAAASQVRNLFGIATAALTGLSGKGIYFSNATGDYTAGTGTSVTFTVVYQLLTATI